MKAVQTSAIDKSKRLWAHFAYGLALAALLVQFVASFGHIHQDDFARLFAGHGKPAISAPHGDSTPIPATPDEDGCEICQVMHMASGTALPPPALLALPVVAVVIGLALPPAQLLLSPPAFSLFRTRAPPIL